MLVHLILSSLLAFYAIECSSDREKINAAGNWLVKFGYKSTFTENEPEEALRESIKELQTFASLKVTGKLDDDTMALIKTPRCGLRDPKIKVTTRGRRYVHQGSTWNNLFRTQKGPQTLKWTLLNSARYMHYQTALKVMRQAFNYWQEKTNVNFIEIPREEARTTAQRDNIEILVKFSPGRHGDPFPFDGQGGTLAHAFYPHNNKGLSGDVHFDDDEHYTYKSPEGRNLLWVATHEIGHSLGLEHSNVREAVMFPWYTKYKPGFKLHPDDVRGIQTLYGSRVQPLPGLTTTTTTKKPTTTTTKRPIPTNAKCPVGAGDITAIYYSKRYRKHIAFTNRDKILLLGYSNSIPVIQRRSRMPRFNRKVDAIANIEGYYRRKKYTQVVFSGDRYYLFNGFSYVAGNFHIDRPYEYDPLRLSFNGQRLYKIDAALTWQRNKRTYFFSGYYYWRYNNERKTFDRGYPKLIRGNWRGLPDKIDAASSSAKGTFFISGKNVYYFDDRNVRVKSIQRVERLLKCKGVASLTAPDGLQVGAIGDITVSGNNRRKP